LIFLPEGCLRTVEMGAGNGGGDVVKHSREGDATEDHLQNQIHLEGDVPDLGETEPEQPQTRLNLRRRGEDILCFTFF
jgi:hypothetical protein